jgi:hypothetical protein
MAIVMYVSLDQTLDIGWKHSHSRQPSLTCLPNCQCCTGMNSDIICMWLKTLRCMVTTSYILKTFDTIWQSLIIHDSWRKFKRNECLITVCKSDKDLSWLYINFSFVFDFLGLDNNNVYFKITSPMRRIRWSFFKHPIFVWYTNSCLRLEFVYQIKIGCSRFN